MAHIVVADAQTWLEGTKARLTTLDLNLEAQISADVLGRLRDTITGTVVDSWVDNTTTPELVKQVISMFYAGWYYDRQYSEMVAAEGTSYGMVLREYAETLLEGLIGGTIIMTEVPPNEPTGSQPVFYPNDASSSSQVAQENTDPDDLSLGPAIFGTQKVF